eukprot:89348-Pleurochrysis_carterae.AAC.1
MAKGLIEDLRFCLNQRRCDPELSSPSAAEAEGRLLIRWDSIPSSETTVEPVSHISQHTSTAALSLLHLC